MNTRSIAAAFAACVAALATAAQPRADTMPLADLAQQTHVHGLAVNPGKPTELYLATHHGLFVVQPDGTATRVSPDTNDYMGFTVHPTEPSILFASGHPAGGGNMGFIQSSDGGRSWTQIAEGVHGPVDFHQMDVSKADPQTIYGVFGDLQVSRDAGKTWQVAGAVPDKLIDLAASAQDPSTLYAATEGGLLKSTDGGASWKPTFPSPGTASMVQTTPDGAVYAFIGGVGLVRSIEPATEWSTLSNAFGDRWLIHFAADPSDAKNLYAVTHTGELLASRDGGQSWAVLGSP